MKVRQRPQGKRMKVGSEEPLLGCGSQWSQGGVSCAEWLSRSDRESSETWEAKCRGTAVWGRSPGRLRGGRGWVSDGGAQARRSPGWTVGTGDTSEHLYGPAVRTMLQPPRPSAANTAVLQTGKLRHRGEL